MIYIIAIKKSKESNITDYRIFDTCSDSTMLIKPNSMYEIMLNTDIKVVNASTGMRKDRIILKNWVHEIATFKSMGFGSKHSGTKYVLLATRDDGTFKIVDYEGTVSSIKLEELTDIIRAKDIANCSTKLDMEDTYKILKDIEFEKNIETKYKSFIAKSSLMGLGQMDFEYEIENQEVRFKKYRGTSENLILPSFITSIMKFAFIDAYLQTIKINTGLRVIGPAAFAPKDFAGTLQRIEIPPTVELVGCQAFISNDRLAGRDGKLHTDRVKLLSNKTYVLENCC